MFGLMVTSLEQGLVFGIMALGVYITFKVLDFPDLTVDGSFPLGAAVASIMIFNGGNPFLALCLATAAGIAAGCITGFLNTRGKITGLLSGILTMTALYSINLRIMGRANVTLLNSRTIFTYIEEWGVPHRWVFLALFIITAFLIKVLLDCFLKTQIGFALRATGDNPEMARANGINTDTMKILGLSLSNGLIALSGALVAQYQGFADIGMGIGTIVAGLASVIIGEMMLGERTICMATFATLMGSFIYRLSIGIALRLGFAATDLKLLTTVLVIIALSTPKIRNLLRSTSSTVSN
ncbi:ABC transporter permease [Caldicoprobacter faecalis]|uniref:Putative ABC transport system permease protein n=1 Tax=Caldicoprobacter faecalis TaxID=937334 RepID=A0A1I5RZM9_9FIRM|nr:ABC transporter permease [Caldicoprobacter faecalis]SFP63877.1 putative ABC transport system permease protein [Caldicoprobacter faecalis]